jgi:hypothetical protein
MVVKESMVLNSDFLSHNILKSCSCRRLSGNTLLVGELSVIDYPALKTLYALANTIATKVYFQQSGL